MDCTALLMSSLYAARFPKSCTVERKLLEGLARHPKDVPAALKALPYSMRTLCVRVALVVYGLCSVHFGTVGTCILVFF